MRHYINILFTLTFLACNIKAENKQTERQQIPFRETGLKIVCTRAIKTLDNEIHGVYYVDNNGNRINKDSLKSLLYSISQLDDFTQSNSTSYITGKNTIYEKTNKNEKVYKLITTSFLMENPGNLPIDNPIKSQIVLQDFDLFLNDTRKQITIRVLNDYEIIKLKINTTEIRRLSESIPVGLEKVTHKLDSLKEQNAGR